MWGERWELGVSKGTEWEVGLSGQENMTFTGVICLSSSATRAESS